MSQTDQYKKIEARSSKTINSIADGGVGAANTARTLIYIDSIKVVKRYPFGIGTDNFDAIKVESPYMAKEGCLFNHAHNEILNVAVENGLQGVVLLAILILFVMYSFWRNLTSPNDLVRVFASLGLMLVFCHIIFGQTQAVFSHHDTLIFFVFFLYPFFGQIQLLNSELFCSTTI